MASKGINATRGEWNRERVHHGAYLMGAPRLNFAADLVDDVLTFREACAFLKIGKTAMYAQVGAGKIPHRYVGRQIRFSRAALVRWLSSCSGNGAKEGA